MMYKLSLIVNNLIYKKFYCSFCFFVSFLYRFDCTDAWNGCSWWYGHHDTGTYESYASNDASTFSVISPGACMPGPRYTSTYANHLSLKAIRKFIQFGNLALKQASFSSYYKYIYPLRLNKIYFNLLILTISRQILKK